MPVDFTDATKYYNVSTVNYLAAGSCNFNDGGVSLWPLDQIVNDTQYYVRDAVIDYITAKGTVSPKIEGRLLFADTTDPVVTITSPEAKTYVHSGHRPADLHGGRPSRGDRPCVRRQVRRGQAGRQGDRRRRASTSRRSLSAATRSR